MINLLNDTIEVYTVTTSSDGRGVLTLTLESTQKARFVSVNSFRFNTQNLGNDVQIVSTIWVVNNINKGSIIKYNDTYYRVESIEMWKAMSEITGYKCNCSLYDNTGS